MAFSAAYSGLNRAQLSYEYLHTNSTTHEFLFGALAELVDNARDANASKLEIFTVPARGYRGGHLLCFQDDGDGMDPGEAASVITFGRSSKKGTDSALIGQYGNGLKSGSMRIANDVILFTKKEQTMSCLMISRTFHEEEKLKEVIVPLPSFHVQNHSPIYEGGRKGKERHDTEMDLILKYSPFHTREEFFEQFQIINGKAGTLVIVYNLKLLDTGYSELDFKKDPQDILLAEVDFHTDKRLVPERYSFRAYLAILYYEPRMKIYLQRKKVQAHRFVYSLYKPRCFKYVSSRFKTRSQQEAKTAAEELKSVTLKVKEAEGRVKELQAEYDKAPNNKDLKAKLRPAEKAFADLQEEKEYKQRISDRKQKALKEPKELTFIYGLNLENRKCDGLFIYNCKRLIKMYERTGPQEDNHCRGVVGIVDIPYIVLEPTHNKQDFADAKEYRHLLKALGEHMEQYWRSLNIKPDAVESFWASYGYLSPRWDYKPSQEHSYVQKRAMQIQTCIQCDTCLKWRVLPYSAYNVGKIFPDDWTCSLNSDVSRNRCSAAEEKLNVPESKFQKTEKSWDDRGLALKKKINKLTEDIKKHDRLEQVHDSKSAAKVMSKVQNRKGKGRVARQRSPSVSSADERRESASSREQTPLAVPKYKGPHKKTEYPSRPIRKAPAPVTKRINKVHKIGGRRIASDSENSDVEIVGAHEGDEENKVNADTSVSPVSSGGLQCSPSPLRPQRLSNAEYEPPMKKTRSSMAATSSSSKNFIDFATHDYDSWPEDSDEEDSKLGKWFVGAKVVVEIRGEWYLGQITRKIADDVVVKFDKRPEDKYDKRLPVISKKMKLALGASDVLQHEQPSSSTMCSGGLQSTEHALEEIGKGYRTCLHYFLPPDWVMDKDKVNCLTPQELVNFPLDDFFDNYERGLRQLVSGFQAEATAARQDAEKANVKLNFTNRLIARLLNSIHEDCNLDPEKDSDKVEELLQACVQQAEMSVTQTDQVSTSSNVITL